jgi:hypothetical protein
MTEKNVGDDSLEVGYEEVTAKPAAELYRHVCRVKAGALPNP